MKEIIKNASIILVLGLVYYIWVRCTNIMIPCMFRKLTGLRCPGCGITHMFLDMAQGKFEKAFGENQFIFVTLPFIVIEILFWKKIEKKHKKANSYILILYVIMLILFGIIRNLLVFANVKGSLFF